MTDQAKCHNKARSVLELRNVIFQISYEEHYKKRKRNSLVVMLFTALLLPFKYKKGLDNEREGSMRYSASSIDRRPRGRSPNGTSI